MNASFGQIPQVEQVLNDQKIKHWDSKISHSVRASLVRSVLAKVREEIKKGTQCPPAEEIVGQVEKKYQKAVEPSLKKCINATGIVLHTNLGRAPIYKKHLTSMAEELSGYCTLEIDTESASRGARTEKIEYFLKELTGAESSLVVNNNAAALFLILHTFAKNQEVLISRSELVQIGGGFRVPEILQESGAILKEVGTTNITTLGDYEKNISPQKTALLMKVFQSCFSVSGHVESPALAALSKVAKKTGIPFVIDYGSGALDRDAGGETCATDILRADPDLLCFSGDKLLGGPQSGIIVGRESMISKMKISPLYRALRLGKYDLFLLEKVLLDHLCEAKTLVDELLGESVQLLKIRAEKFSKVLGEKGISSLVVEGTTSIGGGTEPGVDLPSILVQIPVSDSESAARALSRNTPSVQVRKGKKYIQLDLRTVFKEDEALLLEALRCLS